MGTKGLLTIHNSKYFISLKTMPGQMLLLLLKSRTRVKNIVILFYYRNILMKNLIFFDVFIISSFNLHFHWHFKHIYFGSVLCFVVLSAFH